MKPIILVLLLSAPLYSSRLSAQAADVSDVPARECVHPQPPLSPNTLAYFTNFVGASAACINAMQVIPQVYHLVKVWRVDGLSQKAIVMGLLSSGLWELYGILQRDAVQIIGNAVLISSNVALLITKFIVTRHEESAPLLP